MSIGTIGYDISINEVTIWYTQTRWRAFTHIWVKVYFGKWQGNVSGAWWEGGRWKEPKLWVYETSTDLEST